MKVSRLPGLLDVEDGDDVFVVEASEGASSRRSVLRQNMEWSNGVIFLMATF